MRLGSGRIKGRGEGRRSRCGRPRKTDCAHSSVRCVFKNEIGRSQRTNQRSRRFPRRGTGDRSQVGCSPFRAPRCTAGLVKWRKDGVVRNESCAPRAEDFRRCPPHPQSRTGEARASVFYGIALFTRPSPALSSTRCVHSGCRGPRCAPCIRRQPVRALPAIRRLSP